MKNLKRRIAAARELARPSIALQLSSAWARDAIGRRRYRNLSSDELRATRRGDTVFIFGSGYSINDISQEEWARFADGDTISFNWFPYQRWVRIDYHLIREVATNDFDEAVWRPTLSEYAALLRDNPHYRDTVFLVQKGWRATNGNRLVGLGMLPEGARIFRFTNRGRHTHEPLSESIDDGLVHSAMTLGDCINFAYVMGWRTIVLVGVDMYDHRYFWLARDEERTSIDLPSRGLTVDAPFAAHETVISTIGAWNEHLASRGVALSVYNPRSLLARVLPVYGLDRD